MLDTSRSETRRWPGFLVALKFLTVLSRLTGRDCTGPLVGGIKWFVGKIQGLKRCANDGKLVFWIQMKPLEKVSRNHLQCFLRCSQSHEFLLWGMSRNKHFPPKTPQ